jgi:hypothetical protein
MTNRFYTDGFNAPFGSLAKSLPLDVQFQALQAAFQLVQDELDAFAGIGGITSLPGFPASFVGHGGKQLVVNAAETAVAFVARGALNYKSVAGTSYTLLGTDPGALIAFTAATAVTVTVPPDADVPIDVGAALVLAQYDAGRVTLAAGSGVTLRAADGLVATRVQFSQITLIKVGTNEWLVGGDRV